MSETEPLSREERLKAHERDLARPHDTQKSYRDRDNDHRKAHIGQNRYEKNTLRPHQDNRLQKLDPQQKQVAVKEKPNFKPSGLLAKESNNVKGTQLKYTEPEDAADPPKSPAYTLFIFRDDSKITRQYELSGKSSHLIGRDQKVVDLETDHETCSKQHAVIQFRLRPSVDKSTGAFAKSVRPYIIDLESSNGTFINGQEIPPSRFIELKAEDIVKFGESTTDYVVMTS